MSEKRSVKLPVRKRLPSCKRKKALPETEDEGELVEDSAPSPNAAVLPTGSMNHFVLIMNDVSDVITRSIQDLSSTLLVLDLSRCNLNGCTNVLGKCVNVQVLCLAGNKMLEIPSWAHSMNNLQHLDMSSNKICRVNQLECLAYFHRLRSVFFKGNPVVWLSSYRSTVINCCKPVILLDLFIVSDDEILNSKRHAFYTSDALYTFNSKYGMGNASLKVATIRWLASPSLAGNILSGDVPTVRKKPATDNCSTDNIKWTLNVQKKLLTRMYTCTSPATKIQRYYRHWIRWGKLYKYETVLKLSKLQAVYRGRRYRQKLELELSLLINTSDESIAALALERRHKKYGRIIYIFITKFHRWRKMRVYRKRVETFLILCVYKRRLLLKLLLFYRVSCLVIEEQLIEVVQPRSTAKTRLVLTDEDDDVPVCAVEAVHPLHHVLVNSTVGMRFDNTTTRVLRQTLLKLQCIHSRQLLGQAPSFQSYSPRAPAPWYLPKSTYTRGQSSDFGSIHKKFFRLQLIRRRGYKCSHVQGAAGYRSLSCKKVESRQGIVAEYVNPSFDAHADLVTEYYRVRYKIRQHNANTMLQQQGVQLTKLVCMWDFKKLREVASTLLQSIWRGYCVRTSYQWVNLMDTVIRQRSAVAIQRCWRHHVGLGRRLRMLQYFSDVVDHTVDSNSFYLDAWMFYWLLKCPSLPPLPTSMINYPEFLYIPIVDSEGTGIFVGEESYRCAVTSRSVAGGEGREPVAGVGPRSAGMPGWFSCRPAIPNPNHDTSANESVPIFTTPNMNNLPIYNGKASPVNPPMPDKVREVKKHKMAFNKINEARKLIVYPFVNLLTNHVQVSVVELLQKADNPHSATPTSKENAVLAMKFSFGSESEARKRGLLLMLASFDPTTGGCVTPLSHSQVQSSAESRGWVQRKSQQIGAPSVPTVLNRSLESFTKHHTRPKVAARTPSLYDVGIPLECAIRTVQYQNAKYPAYLLEKCAQLSLSRSFEIEFCTLCQGAAYLGLRKQKVRDMAVGVDKHTHSIHLLDKELIDKDQSNINDSMTSAHLTQLTQQTPVPLPAVDNGVYLPTDAAGILPKRPLPLSTSKGTKLIQYHNSNVADCRNACPVDFLSLDEHTFELGHKAEVLMNQLFGWCATNTTALDDHMTYPTRHLMYDVKQPNRNDVVQMLIGNVLFDNHSFAKDSLLPGIKLAEVEAEEADLVQANDKQMKQFAPLPRSTSVQHMYRQIRKAQIAEDNKLEKERLQEVVSKQRAKTLEVNKAAASAVKEGEVTTKERYQEKVELRRKVAHQLVKGSSLKCASKKMDNEKLVEDNHTAMRKAKAVERTVSARKKTVRIESLRTSSLLAALAKSSFTVKNNSQVDKRLLERRANVKVGKQERHHRHSFDKTPAVPLPAYPPVVYQCDENQMDKVNGPFDGRPKSAVQYSRRSSVDSCNGPRRIMSAGLHRPVEHCLRDNSITDEDDQERPPTRITLEATIPTQPTAARPMDNDDNDGAGTPLDFGLSRFGSRVGSVTSQFTLSSPAQVNRKGSMAVPYVAAAIPSAPAPSAVPTSTVAFDTSKVDANGEEVDSSRKGSGQIRKRAYVTPKVEDVTRRIPTPPPPGPEQLPGVEALAQRGEGSPKQTSRRTHDRFTAISGFN